MLDWQGYKETEVNYEQSQFTLHFCKSETINFDALFMIFLWIGPIRNEQGFLCKLSNFEEIYVIEEAQNFNTTPSQL